MPILFIVPPILANKQCDSLHGIDGMRLRKFICNVEPSISNIFNVENIFAYFYYCIGIFVLTHIAQLNRREWRENVTFLEETDKIVTKVKRK